MQSIRGLRWTVPSTSPRYASRHCPRRSFANSFIWHSVKQPSPSPGVDGSRTTKFELRDPNGRGESIESNHETRDLCSSFMRTMARLPHPVVVITTLDRTYQAQAAAGVPIKEMRHPIARGVTVSSLTSLCIQPRPHVMFNMTLPSTMYEALVACRDFNVHVLAPDKYGAHVAGVFTRGNRPPSPRAGQSGCSDYAFDIDADLGVFVGLKEKGVRHVEIANRDAWHDQYQAAKDNGTGILKPSRDVDAVQQNRGAAEPLRQVHHVPCLRSRGIIEVLNCHLVRTIHPELPHAGQKVIMIGEVVDVTHPVQSNETPDQAPVALGYADRKYRSVGGVVHPH